MKQLLILGCIWLFLVTPVIGQHILFTEDFEGGTLGDFVGVNGQQAISWYAGIASTNGPHLAGSTAAFVSSDASMYERQLGLDGVVHLYRDIAFPASETVFNLRFDFRSEGILQVFLVPTSYHPVAGVTPPYQMISNGFLNNRTAYSSATLSLNANVAGTTQRLVFTWTSRKSVNELPAAIDNIQLLAGAIQPLAGTYTINRQKPAGGRNYHSFTEAIWQLNTAGTAAPVTFEVAAGQRFTEGPPPLLGSNAHPVVFRKGGLGTNPELQAEGSQTAIEIYGANYLTFDGIDIIPGTDGPNIGYAITNRLNKYGSHHIIIRNATITLRQNQEQTKGIYQYSSLFSKADTAAVNGHITYENLTIRQACHGLWIASASQVVPDYDVEVSHITVGDGSTRNIGYLTAGYEAYGMYFMRINGLHVHDNIVQSVTTRNGFVVGIYVYDLMGPRPSIIANNRIRDLEFLHPAVLNGSPICAVIGLTVLQAAPRNNFAAANNVSIYNNEIHSLRHSLLLNATMPIRGGTTEGIVASTGGFAASNMRLAHNTVSVTAPPWPGFGSITMSLRCAEINHGKAEVLNNLLVNETPATSESGIKSVLGLHIRTGHTPQSTGVYCDHNDLVAYTGAKVITGYVSNGSSALYYSTLTDWQAATKLDSHSVSINPRFATESVLRPTNSLLDNIGAPLGYVTTDLEGITRSRTPDIGAYEFGSVLSTTTQQPILGLRAWPVPFSNELYVSMDAMGVEEIQMELFDVLGRVVRRQSGYFRSAPLHLTGMNVLPAGAYLLRLSTTDGRQQVLRLIH